MAGEGVKRVEISDHMRDIMEHALAEYVFKNREIARTTNHGGIYQNAMATFQNC